jgi:hypothetical protein
MPKEKRNLKSFSSSFSFKIAAKKVFSDLYDLIKEDENMTTNKINDKQVKSNKLDLNNDILGKKNECLSIPIVLILMMKKLKHLKLLIDIVLLK